LKKLGVGTMAKRFTETDKWKDSWFLDLSAGQKLVWLYFLDNCDNAGFIEINLRYMAFVIGIDEDKILGAIKGLNRGLLGPKNNVYFIKNFLKHQKNIPLNSTNNAHKQIINIFTAYKKDFPQIYKTYVGTNKGLISPTGIGKGIVKVDKKQFKKPTLAEVEEFCKEQAEYRLDAKKIFDGYDTADWKDSHGKQIKNWKQKIIHVWCKDENKQDPTDNKEQRIMDCMLENNVSRTVAEQMV
jgi:hypothetical protein